MDPIAIATAVTSLLALFLKNAGAAALDKLTDQLPDSVGNVWSAISKKSESITDAASDFAKNPDDADTEVLFKKQLQQAFEKDQEFANLITDLIKKAESDTTIKVSGDGIVANNNSTVVGGISIGSNVGGNIVIDSRNSLAGDPSIEAPPPPPKKDKQTP